MRIEVDEHPLLDAFVFTTCFGEPIVSFSVDKELTDYFSPNAGAPLASDDDVRKAVRNLLRYGGFKPTGRSKPASEYLLKAVTNGNLSSINLPVDVCNAVSLHSGLPISVIDLDLAQAPFRLGIAPPGSSYVFNASGQEIDISGLLCLFDKQGPCANGVKDSQRTKTSESTKRTLSVIWGTSELEDRTADTFRWYCELLSARGATVEPLNGHRESRSQEDDGTA